MNFYEFLPKKLNISEFIEISFNFCQFFDVFRRIFLIYFAHAPHVDTPIPVYDPITRISLGIRKKNLKNPKFPPIFKIPFLRNVNLRKIIILNFDFQINVLYIISAPARFVLSPVVFFCGGLLFFAQSSQPVYLLKLPGVLQELSLRTSRPPFPARVLPLG